VGALGTSLRHEIQRNNRECAAQDFTRLKLLVGWDFFRGWGEEGSWGAGEELARGGKVGA
jgi:hypothetical protein